jgi:RNA polymerase-associated protein RTF1
MSDVDALNDDILALADSSDDESPQQPTAAKSPSSSSERGAAPTPSTKTTQKKAKARRPKRVRNPESEEEGEASSGKDSEDSVPMDESDADVGTPGSDASGPMFPLENKYTSEEDKAKVLAMPEVEREALLAERAAAVERKYQDNILKRLYEGYQNKDQDKKRKAEDDLEGDRKSSRQRTLVGGRKVGETNSAMEAYKAQREQKGILAEQRKQDAADRKAGKGRRRSLGESSVDADGESEVEWDNTKSKQPEQPRFDEPADLKDYNHCKIGQFNFAVICFYPKFEETVKDCFVRVKLGPNEQGVDVYRMAKIVKITEGRPYAIENDQGKKLVTNQYAHVAIGKREREYPFLYCSMKFFEPSELTAYKANLANDGMLPPKKSFLIEKNKQIHALLATEWTEQSLQEKLQRSGVLKQKADAVERQALIHRRVAAESRHDEAAIEQINARLKELEPPKLAFGTFIHDPRPDNNKSKGPTQQERLAELNRKNRKADIESARRAEYAAKRAKNKNRLSVHPNKAPGSGAITPTGSQDTATPAASQLESQKTTSDEALLSTVAKKAPVKTNANWVKYDPMAAMNAAAMGGVDENGNKKSVFKYKPSEDEILASFDLDLDIDIDSI